MLYALAVGGVLLGTVFGLVFRLALFVFILLLLVAAFVAASLIFGWHSIVLRAVAGAAALQVGYVVGIVTRAVTSRLAAGRDLSGRAVNHYPRTVGKPKQQ
jgi:hypothetical protein